MSRPSCLGSLVSHFLRALDLAPPLRLFPVSTTGFTTLFSFLPVPVYAVCNLEGLSEKGIPGVGLGPTSGLHPVLLSQQPLYVALATSVVEVVMLQGKQGGVAILSFVAVMDMRYN